MLVFFNGLPYHHHLRFFTGYQSKKKEILLDNKSFLKFEKITLAAYSFKDLLGNEILFFQTKQDAVTSATYLVFNFVGFKRKVESTNVGRISRFRYKNMIEKTVSWLLEDKVLNTDGYNQSGTIGTVFRQIQ